MARKSLQKLLDICPFLLAGEMVILKSKEHLHQKLLLVARRAALIGCTNPSEHTAGSLVKTIEILGGQPFASAKAYVDAVSELKGYIKCERVTLPDYEWQRPPRGRPAGNYAGPQSTPRLHLT